MRVWNLSEAEDLVERVVAPLPRESQFGRRRVPVRAKHPLFVKLQLFAGVASLAITISAAGIVSKDSVRLPSWEAVVSRSAPNIRGPLESIFEGRFNPQWREDDEASLLRQVVESRLLAEEPESARKEVARFIFSNQQESLTIEAPRLNLLQVERIVKERKTS
jgi:hypothetical protein